MNHFQGINPEERWRNDLLNELRKLNEHLSAQKAETPENGAQEPKTRKQRKPKGSE